MMDFYGTISDLSTLPNSLMIWIGVILLLIGPILFRKPRRYRVKWKFAVGIILTVVGVGLLFLALWLYP